MNNEIPFGLLNDSIVGHLLCVYLKLSLIADDKYYFVIKQSEQLVTSVPGNLKQLGLCDIKKTFGPELIAVADKYERHISVYSQLSVTAQSNNFVHYQDKLKECRKLLKKYKPLETPVDYKDIEKFERNHEITNSLAYVISFDKDQYAKFTPFFEKYIRQFLEKELDGQQNYLLPEIYVNYLANRINNPAYVNMFGRKNVQITKEKEQFFCHSIAALALDKKIGIRKMYVIDQDVIVNFDNLIPTENESINNTKTNNVEENLVSDSVNKPLPNDVKWITSDNKNILLFDDGRKLEFKNPEKPSAKYFKLLIENHDYEVKHKFATEKIENINKGQIENCTKVLRKKVITAKLTNRIKFHTEHEGGYILTIS